MTKTFEQFLDSLDITLTDDQLAHYGVKGQKWGVVKSESTNGDSGGDSGGNSGGNSGSRGGQKSPTIQSPQAKNGVVAIGGASYDEDDIQNLLDNLTDEEKELYAEFLKKNPKVTLAEFMIKHRNALKAKYNNMTAYEPGTNEIKLTKEGKNLFKKGYAMWIEDPKNNPLSEVLNAKPLSKREALEIISEKKTNAGTNGTAKHSNISFEDFLAHYGVKGMKWGVTRTIDLSISRDSGEPGGVGSSGGAEIPEELEELQMIISDKALLANYLLSKDAYSSKPKDIGFKWVQAINNLLGDKRSPIERNIDFVKKVQNATRPARLWLNDLFDRD